MDSVTYVVYHVWFGVGGSIERKASSGLNLYVLDCALDDGVELNSTIKFATLNLKYLRELAGIF